MIYKYKIDYKLIGGSSSTLSSASSTKNVLFACTTLHKNSTLSKNFVTINEKVREDLGEDELQAYFVYKSLIEDKLNNIDLQKELEDKKYVINYPQDINLIEFLKQNENLKFDKIILTQCNEIITIIIGEIKWNNSYGYGKNLYKDIFNNLFQIYNSLTETGVIINYYINISTQNVSLFSFSNTLAPMSFSNFHYVLFILKLIPEFFKEIDIGIYKKKLNVNLDSINIDETINDIIISFDQTKNYTTVEEYKNFFIKSINELNSNENNILNHNILNNINILTSWREIWFKDLSEYNEQPSSFKI